MATLVRILGDIGMAEDAVQDAFAIAMSTWPDTGMPDNPGAWITTTARNRAVDRIRRDRRGRELLGEVAVLHHDAPEEVAVVQPVADDMLRLVFTSCHPTLSPQAQVALTLRLVIGLSTADVARALVVTEPTMAQRLVRA
ncbi:MAG TPA: sigma-70 family RNA polymerase sigma factor, partial [Nitriliruptoraceae bacterium]|nr:sigma-70 family RNA polymerase sigma factor [Nitriliruptoraceae bacterium]